MGKRSVLARASRRLTPGLAWGVLFTGLVCQGRLAAQPSPYPASPRGNVVEEIHGTPVADPYRWLE